MGNRMTDVINKIERRLGTKPLNLPDFIAKDSWAESVIIPDTITTFSRFFPNKIRVKMHSNYRKDGYYIIDEAVTDNMEIIGVRDIGWEEFARGHVAFAQNLGMGYYDYTATNFNLDDIALLSVRANQTSLINNGIYIDYIPPNKLRLISVTGADISKYITEFPIDVFVKHAPNLMTISQTLMEIFEKLAMADVAIFLFEYLKHYDGLETVFANVDLKLSYLESQAQKRDDVIQKLEDSYVSAANENQPIMFTV